MIGVTLTASHAFMLPVSTPCNAIVYTAGCKEEVGLRIQDMLGVGIILNTLCLMTTLLCLHTWTGAVFDMSPAPAWVNTTSFTSSTHCS